MQPHGLGERVVRIGTEKPMGRTARLFHEGDERGRVKAATAAVTGALDGAMEGGRKEELSVRQEVEEAEERDFGRQSTISGTRGEGSGSAGIRRRKKSHGTQRRRLIRGHRKNIGDNFDK